MCAELDSSLLKTLLSKYNKIIQLKINARQRENEGTKYLKLTRYFYWSLHTINFEEKISGSNFTAQTFSAHTHKLSQINQHNHSLTDCYRQRETKVVHSHSSTYFMHEKLSPHHIQKRQQLCKEMTAATTTSFKCIQECGRWVSWHADALYDLEDSCGK